MSCRHILVTELAVALDTDPTLAGLRRRGGDAASEPELRALRGAWVAAVLRALGRRLVEGRSAVRRGLAWP